LVIHSGHVKQINATTFKAKCLAILDEVERTGEPVVILKRGRVVAQLGRATGRSGFPQMQLEGSGQALDDLIAPAVPADAWEAVPPAKP
jgi:antitoxin (DNA-binding transcriptional repressor) of toxin-antitoxin stability system